MKLHSTVVGDGPPLVLIHGLFGSQENLGALARNLKQSFCVYSLDLPNHGRSSHGDKVDLKTMKEAVCSWMDDARLASAAIVGHSLGGKVAMEIALNEPTRAETLVVMDIAPVAYDPHHNSIFAALEALDLATYTRRNEIDLTLSQAIPETAVRSFLLKNLARAESGGYQWRMNLNALSRDYPQLIRENTEAVYDGATLFLKGGTSDYLKSEHQTAVVSRFPAAEFKVVAGTGHWLHAEKPELVASLIKKFVLAAPPSNAPSASLT